MNLAISLITLLALLLQAHHTHQHRALKHQLERAELRRRLTAVELALPRVEAEYGANSHSARYLRAARYMTSLRLRHLNAQAGHSAVGGTR